MLASRKISVLPLPRWSTVLLSISLEIVLTIHNRSYYQIPYRLTAAVRPSPVLTHGQHPSHVPCNLQSATHVFVQYDAHRTPLQWPYDGPFHFLHGADKFLKVNLGTRTDNVSIDRLKLAFMDAPSISASPGSQSPLATTSVPSQHLFSPTALSFVPSTPFSGLPNSGYITKAGWTIHLPTPLCPIVEDHWGGAL